MKILRMIGLCNNGWDKYVKVAYTSVEGVPPTQVRIRNEFPTLEDFVKDIETRGWMIGVSNYGKKCSIPKFRIVGITEENN
jgi:hypothetical protein